ncbi:unnamed protein product [Dibothriocephalus latus]|uniref:Transmembrane protein n=1 Tax=Dibothriocephalus latus TaxID=60516 RepID=A0A3P6TIK8_DIBLA|nr:unnamed protein product [Dibothriocephalus latus]
MLLSSAADAKMQHPPGYFDTPLKMTAGTITPSNNTSWDRILRLLVTPDGQYTSYLVFCSATLTIALILLLLLVLLLVAKRRKSPPYGLSLKYLYLKTAEKVEFVKFNEDHKFSRKREPTFTGKYALLESRLTAARKKPNHADFANLSNGQHFSFPPFTCVKKAAIVSYLSFRVFYTFIFTFSVALSMLFSLWPPYLDGSTASTQNPSVVPRGRLVGLREPTVESSYSFVSQLPLAQQIAFSRETLTDEELSVQITRATQVVLACQQLVITQIVDVVRELDHVIQKLLDDELSLPEVKWNDSVRTAMPSLIPPPGSSAAATAESASTPGTSPNLLQVMDTFVMWLMTEFHQAIQNYLRHLKTEVEYAMMPDVALFSDMLSRVYSSQWLLFARRMLNSTAGGYEGAGSGSRWWKPVDSADIVSSVDAETTGANMSKIDFARQLGLAEAENFLWTPTRIEKE